MGKLWYDRVLQIGVMLMCINLVFYWTFNYYIHCIFLDVFDSMLWHCFVAELKSSYNSSEQNSQKAVLELSDVKKKLREQKKSSESMETNAKKYRSLLETLRHQMVEGTAAIQKSLGEADTSKTKVKTESQVKTEVNGEK